MSLRNLNQTAGFLQNRSGEAEEVESQPSRPAVLPKSRLAQRVQDDTIEVGRIVHDAVNFRTSELRNIPQLAVSIRERGLLQPIAVVPVRNEAGDITGYICKVGNRRLAALQLLAEEDVAKWGRVRATIIVDGDGMDEAIMSNMHIDPLSLGDRGRVFAYLHDVKRYTDAEIGSMYNLGRQLINAMRNHIPELDAGATVFDITHGTAPVADAGGFVPGGDVPLDDSNFADSGDEGQRPAAVSDGRTQQSRAARAKAIRQIDPHRPLTSATSYIRKQRTRLTRMDEGEIAILHASLDRLGDEIRELVALIDKR